MIGSFDFDVVTGPSGADTPSAGARVMPDAKTRQDGNATSSSPPRQVSQPRE